MSFEYCAHPISAQTRRPRSKKRPSVKALWKTIELELGGLARTMPGVWIELEPRESTTNTWDWPTAVSEAPSTVDRAVAITGHALTAFASYLPLERIPPEVPSAFITRDGNLVIDIVDLSVDATVVRMVSPEDVNRFAEARARKHRPQAWDTARTRRLMRLDGHGWRHVLEPGVNFFVEWLEAEGATTYYSCEGHPNGFYLVFSADVRLARSIAIDDLLSVVPIRSRVIDIAPGDEVGADGIGLWKASLAVPARNYDDLDLMLDTVALRWTNAQASPRNGHPPL